MLREIAIATVVMGSLAGASTSVNAAEVRVLSSNAMTDVMTHLVPDFERATGHKVLATYEPTSAIMNRVKGGESADVVILLRQSIDDLQKAGKVMPGTEADVAKTSLGIAIREGATKPDISTVE